MTTDQYRAIVIGQIVAVFVLGLVTVLVFINAVPAFRARGYLADAIESYASGTEADVRGAKEALDGALGIDRRMPGALALQGRIAIEEGALTIAYDAYRRLEEIASARGEPTAAAVNGIGCAMLLEAQRSSKDRRERMNAALEKFRAAIEQDPMNGDPRVNAAVCQLNLGDWTGAADHLKAARNTRNLTYESLVTYHSALGSLLAASSRGRRQAMAVADALKDPDPKLWKTGRMLFRAVNEFGKAAELARPEKTRAELHANAAVVKGKLLAWAPLDRGRATRYREAVFQALRDYPGRFTLDQRQLLHVIVAVSYRRDGNVPTATGWLRRALQLGAARPEALGYIGSAMLFVAQGAKQADQRARLEAEASKLLLKSLEDGALRDHLQFRAWADLAVGQWHAKDFSGALEHMKKAATLFARLERRPGALAKSERRRFCRNYAIMLYRSGEVPAAVKQLEKALAIDASEKAARELLAKMSQRPVVGGLGAITTEKLPPNMPIITATVSGGGPTGVLKKNISVEIDGRPVRFTCGPNGRIYALPRTALPEGKHTAQVTVVLAGQRMTTARKEFDVKYEYQLVPVR